MQLIWECSGNNLQLSALLVWRVTQNSMSRSFTLHMSVLRDRGSKQLFTWFTHVSKCPTSYVLNAEVVANQRHLNVTLYHRATDVKLSSDKDPVYCLQTKEFWRIRVLVVVWENNWSDASIIGNSLVLSCFMHYKNRWYIWIFLC